MWVSLIIEKTFYSFIRAENWENLLWMRCYLHLRWYFCKCIRGSRVDGIFWDWSIPADQKDRQHPVQFHQFIHQKHPVNMARLFQWGIGDQFEMFSENLWIARDHKCDEKPHRLPRGPGEVNQNCPHHHHQHPHHRHIINPRFECTVDMRCLVSYIQWFHTTPDNGGSEYWRTKIQNFQEHRSLQDTRS